jgi:hypothetical protein
LLKRFWKSCKGGELFQILLTDGDGSIAKSWLFVIMKGRGYTHSLKTCLIQNILFGVFMKNITILCVLFHTIVIYFEM